MAVTPLAVAVVAMGLLVVSVGFEVVFQRTYSVDVQVDSGWQTIGQSGDRGSGRMYSEPKLTSGAGAITVARNETLEFRIRVDNGYPWSYSEAYDVRVEGVIVAEGELAAEARSEGTSTFTVPASTFFARMSPDPERNLTTAYFDVQIGSAYVSASFFLQEAA